MSSWLGESSTASEKQPRRVSHGKPKVYAAEAQQERKPSMFGDIADEMDAYRADKVMRSVRNHIGEIGRDGMLSLHTVAHKSTQLKKKLNTLTHRARKRAEQKRSAKLMRTESAMHAPHTSSVGALIGLVSTVKEAQYRGSLTKPYRCFVVHPNAPFRRYWDLIALVLLTYTAVFTPFQIAFLSEEMTFDNISEWPVAFTIDRLVDFVFLLDLFVNFRSAWVTDEGFIVFNAQQCAIKYLKSWFLIDFLSILPYDALSKIPGVDSKNAGTLRFPKLLRLLRLMKIAKVMKASRIYKRWEQNISVKYGWIRLLSFCILIVLLSHWLGCGLFLTHTLATCEMKNFIGYGERCVPTHDTWVSSLSDIPEGPGSTRAKYAASVYWAVMTLTTIGYGDIAAKSTFERCYFVLAMLCGAGFYAYAVGTMCAIVQGLDAGNLEFQATMDSVNEYMRQCDFPPRMRARVRRFMFYKRDAGQMEGEDEVLKHFSPSIGREIALYNYKSILHQVPQFTSMPMSFLADIALSLCPAVFGPNEYVCIQACPADQLFILKQGRVQIERVNADGHMHVLDTLSRNSFFGEYNLLYGTVSDVSVRTLEFCDTMALSKFELDKILARFPEMNKFIRRSFLKSLLRKRLLTGELNKLLKNVQFMKEMEELGKVGFIATKKSEETKVLDLAPSGGANRDLNTALLERLCTQMEKQDRRINLLQESVTGIVSKLAHLHLTDAATPLIPGAII